MHLFDQGDVFDDIEIGEQGGLLAYLRNGMRVQSTEIVMERLVVIEEFYSD
jgi:hypothetical protein